MSMHYVMDMGSSIKQLSNLAFKPEFVLRNCLRVYVDEQGKITALMPSKNQIVYRVGDADYDEMKMQFSDMDNAGKRFKQTGVVSDRYGVEFVRIV